MFFIEVWWSKDKLVSHSGLIKIYYGNGHHLGLNPYDLHVMLCVKSLSFQYSYVNKNNVERKVLRVRRQIFSAYAQCCILQCKYCKANPWKHCSSFHHVANTFLSTLNVRGKMLAMQRLGKISFDWWWDLKIDVTMHLPCKWWVSISAQGIWLQLIIDKTDQENPRLVVGLDYGIVQRLGRNMHV